MSQMSLAHEPDTDAENIHRACVQIAQESMGLWQQYLAFQGPHRTRTVTRALGQFHGLKVACRILGRSDLADQVEKLKLEFLASFEPAKKAHEAKRKKTN